MTDPKKTIVINPDFLKLPMRGNKTRKNSDKPITPKPIKIRTELDKTYKRRALNYIRKHQEDKYKRLMKGVESNEVVGRGNNTNTNTYADNFKSDFDDSLDFLQKLTDQTAQKIQVHNATLRRTPGQPPIVPNSTLFHTPVLNSILDQQQPSPVNSGFSRTPERISGATSVVNGGLSREDLSSKDNENSPFSPSPLPVHLPKPMYGCLKGGLLPTYRTLKAQEKIDLAHSPTLALRSGIATNSLENVAKTETPATYQPNLVGGLPRLTPEQQRAELKQFLEKRKEEKDRIELVKRQRNILNPVKKQKRITRRTFRVGKSKHYPRIGVLIPNKTIRTQVLANKQKMREIPLQDVRKYLIKKGLIRVGSSCPNDVLRQMYESSMMMCGEIQNHNPDNLLYNYLHNGL